MESIAVPYAERQVAERSSWSMGQHRDAVCSHSACPYRIRPHARDQGQVWHWHQQRWRQRHRHQQYTTAAAKQQQLIKRVEHSSCRGRACRRTMQWLWKV